jgi:hypothetical protein
VVTILDNPPHFTLSDFVHGELAKESLAYAYSNAARIFSTNRVGSVPTIQASDVRIHFTSAHFGADVTPWDCKLRRIDITFDLCTSEFPAIFVCVRMLRKVILAERGTVVRIMCQQNFNSEVSFQHLHALVHELLPGAEHLKAQSGNVDIRWDLDGYSGFDLTKMANETWTKEKVGYGFLQISCCGRR